MRLVWAHLRAGTLELLRYPSFSVPTLLFPSIFLLVLGLQYADGRADAVMASFAAFAVMGVAFFQFGVGIAVERTSPWHLFLRTLPAPALVRFAARTLSAALFGLAAAAGVVVTALLTTDAGLGPAAWLRFVVALAVGSVPFALLGIALGYWLTPRGALPGANLLYLGLAYAGGLWTSARQLPGLLDGVSTYLPTRRWAEVLWASVDGRPWRAADWLWLGGYAALFGALAAWGYRRDEGERFR
jgi:ABC-2 type transport system permease protein